MSCFGCCRWADDASVCRSETEAWRPELPDGCSLSWCDCWSSAAVFVRLSWVTSRALSRLSASLCSFCSQIQISKCGLTAEATTDFLFEDFQPVAQWHKQLSAFYWVFFVLFVFWTWLHAAAQILVLKFSWRLFTWTRGAGLETFACLCHMFASCSSVIVYNMRVYQRRNTPGSESTWSITR